MPAFHTNELFAILVSIQQAELHQQKANFSLAHRSMMNPKHLLHQLMARSGTTHEKRLRSRHHFVPAVRKLLVKLSKLSICAAQWIVYKRYGNYSEGKSELCLFVPRPSIRQFGIGLPRLVWIQLNRLRTGVGRFQSSLHKLARCSYTNLWVWRIDQTAAHVILECPLHRVPRGYHGLLIVDD